MLSRKPRIPEGAAMIRTTEVVNHQLREQNNPIDWTRLEKVVLNTMIDLKRDLGKWYSHDELLQFVLSSLNSQITADYKHGTKGLVKRMGWKRTKRKNIT